MLGSKRHQMHKKARKVVEVPVLNQPTARRLAQRGGMQRISKDMIQPMSTLLFDEVKYVLEKAACMSDLRRSWKKSPSSSKPRTLSRSDMLYALTRSGIRVYGRGIMPASERRKCLRKASAEVYLVTNNKRPRDFGAEE
jgi:histone H3/H4